MLSTNKDTDLSLENQLFPASEWNPFPALSWVWGAISTAQDGAVAWGRSLDAEVSRNRRRYLESRGLRIDQAVAIEQIHSNSVSVVNTHDGGRGIIESGSRIPQTDGMISNTPALTLVTSHADCAPLYLADEATKSIGLIHAGWRGILSGICSNAVKSMRATFGTDPRNLRFDVGPMISTAQYEVGTDIANSFKQKYGHQVVIDGSEKPHLDLFACIVIELLQSGVSKDSIPRRPPCTYENSLYSSHRRSAGEATGMIACLRIKK
jgi:hypothetical protein